jgi:hypothetical protein
MKPHPTSRKAKPTPAEDRTFAASRDPLTTIVRSNLAEGADSFGAQRLRAESDEASNSGAVRRTNRLEPLSKSHALAQGLKPGGLFRVQRTG